MHLIELFVELWRLECERNVARVFAIFADVRRSGAHAIDEGTQSTAVCESISGENFVRRI